MGLRVESLGSASQLLKDYFGFKTLEKSYLRGLPVGSSMSLKGFRGLGFRVLGIQASHPKPGTSRC